MKACSSPRTPGSLLDGGESRSGKKIPRQQWHAGSSPASGTKLEADLADARSAFLLRFVHDLARRRNCILELANVTIGSLRRSFRYQIAVSRARQTVSVFPTGDLAGDIRALTVELSAADDVWLPRINDKLTQGDLRAVLAAHSRLRC